MATVLVINCSSALLDELTEGLQTNGFEVVPCESAEEAIDELLADSSIQCILCELYLPRIDGWKLCRLLKNHEVERLRKIPIVLYSHLLSGEAALEISHDSGARSYFTVPTSTANLVDQVQHALEGSRAFHRDKVEVITNARDQLASYLTQLDPLRFFSEGLAPQDSTPEADLSLVAPDVELKELLQLSHWSKENKGDKIWIAVSEESRPESLLSYVKAGFDAVIRPDQVNQLSQVITQCRKRQAVLRIREVEQETQKKASKARRAAGRLLNLFRDN